MGEKSAERLALEARAEELNVKVPANIGDEKLRERVEKAVAATAKAFEADEVIAAETLTIVRWGGKRRAVGSTIEVDAEDFADLEKRGAVRRAD